MNGERNANKTKERLMTAMKIAVAVVLFVVIFLNYGTLKNLDVREVIKNVGAPATAAAAIMGIYLVKSLTLVVPASLIYIYLWGWCSQRGRRY